MIARRLRTFARGSWLRPTGERPGSENEVVGVAPTAEAMRGVPAWTCPWRELEATTHHSFGGSFSAGSKPIFASKAAFFSIFQNLQENHLLASKFRKFLPKNWKFLQNFRHFLANFAKLACPELTLTNELGFWLIQRCIFVT